MDLIERLREQLSREYGINSDRELLEALDKQKPLDIGIFVSRIDQERGVEAVG